MTEKREKKLVSDIMENFPGELITAMIIHDVQIAVLRLTEEYCDLNKPGYPVMWDLVDDSEIPRDFFELCLKVGSYEVRLYD
jgi:hypothetical protein